MLIGGQKVLINQCPRCNDPSHLPVELQSSAGDFLAGIISYFISDSNMNTEFLHKSFEIALQLEEWKTCHRYRRTARPPWRYLQVQLQTPMLCLMEVQLVETTYSC